MKWNFPLLRKLIQFYSKYGLVKTIFFVIFVFLGTKLIIINALIYIANLLFGFGWEYAPILQLIDIDLGTIVPGLYLGY